MLHSFDLETYLLIPGLRTPRPVCGSWANATQEHVATADDAVRFFVEALERGDHLTGVNTSYDVCVIAAYRPDILPLIFAAGNAGLFHDCSIREALNDIAKGELVERGDEESWQRYSMALLMDRHFGEDISADKEGDVWRYKYASLDGVPIDQYPEAARAYPLLDARRTYRIHRAQSAFRNLHDEAAQVRASIAIALMCTWGLRTDAAYIAHLEAEVDALWGAARDEFTKAGIFRANGTKDKGRVQAMVLEAYEGDPPRAPKGGVSTDRDTLVESGNPLLEKLGTSGKNDKRKTTYLPALRAGVDRPLNPEFNVLVATGRVSSDMQQFPQKGGIREAIVARPGYVLGSLDFGGLELRTMAQRAILDPDVRFSKMADFINSGKDVHTHVAAYFLGCTYEELLPCVKAKEPKAVAFRSLAKIFNFGKGGGMGAAAMAFNARTKDGVRFCLLAGRAKVCGESKQEVRVQGKLKRVCTLCVQIAKELGEKWLRAWPEQGLLFQKAGRLTQGNRRIEVEVFGSRRVRGDCGYTQYLNTPFQGAGGDGCKAAMWRIAETEYGNPRSPLWGSRTCLNVHDELFFEFLWDRRHDAAFLAAKIMVETMDQITPDAKNEVVPALMRRMFKSASDVYDRAGVLRPWWPPDANQVWDWAPDRAQMESDLAA